MPLEWIVLQIYNLDFVSPTDRTYCLQLLTVEIFAHLFSWSFLSSPPPRPRSQGPSIFRKPLPLPVPAYLLNARRNIYYLIPEEF